MSQINLKKGEKLFEEGDQSKSAYFIKKGMLRIFKKKYDSTIEIDTIREGQLLGELAFLDNQPRSASAEAIVDSELVEISQKILDDTLAKTPDWLKALLKTITGRLRTSTNKIRILENPSTEYETDKWGNRSKEFIFVNKAELLRFCSALSIVASRFGRNDTLDGIRFPSSMLNRYASQVMQTNETKVAHLIELFRAVNLLKTHEGDSTPSLILTDIQFIDQFVWFVSDQNLLEASKQRTLSNRGFLLMSLIIKNLDQASEDKDGNMTFNIATALEQEGKTLCNPPLRAEELQELQDQKIIDALMANSGSDIQIKFSQKKVILEFRYFWILNELEKLNDKKRKSKS